MLGSAKISELLPMFDNARREGFAYAGEFFQFVGGGGVNVDPL